MTQTKGFAVLAVLWTMTATACDRSTPDPGPAGGLASARDAGTQDSETLAPDHAIDDLTASNPGLPGAADVFNCIASEVPDAPPLCVWAKSVDAIVWGEISELRFPEFPAVTADGGQEVWTCAGPVDEPLEIALTVEDIIMGAAPSEVSVRVGFDQLDEWQPRPALHPSGAEVWVGDGPKLEIGQKLGLALHKAPNGTMWGILGERLFVERADSTLLVQAYSQCQEPAPQGLDGMTRASLRAALAACQETQESQYRRALLAGAWDNRKTWAYAGYCFEPTSPPSGCASAADCPADRPSCVSGNCVSP